MLRKIDCVMIRVGDVPTTADYYVRVFGLRRLWDEEKPGGVAVVGLGMPDTDAEIVVHNDPAIPGPMEVYYLVDDVGQACAEFARAGCVVRVEPFDIAIGMCAIVDDPFGNKLCILDMSKGPRTVPG